MTRQDRYRVSAETGMHPRTVLNWSNGSKVAPQTAYACEAAVKKLKIDVSLPEGDAEQVAG